MFTSPCSGSEPWLAPAADGWQLPGSWLLLPGSWLPLPGNCLPLPDAVGTPKTPSKEKLGFD